MKVILDDGPLVGQEREVPDEALDVMLDGHRYVRHHVDRKGRVHFYHPESYQRPRKSR